MEFSNNYNNLMLLSGYHKVGDVKIIRYVYLLDYGWKCMYVPVPGQLYPVKDGQIIKECRLFPQYDPRWPNQEVSYFVVQDDPESSDSFYLVQFKPIFAQEVLADAPMREKDSIPMESDDVPITDLSDPANIINKILIKGKVTYAESITVYV